MQYLPLENPTVENCVQIQIINNQIYQILFRRKSNEGNATWVFCCWITYEMHGQFSRKIKSQHNFNTRRFQKPLNLIFSTLVAWILIERYLSFRKELSKLRDFFRVQGTWIWSRISDLCFFEVDHPSTGFGVLPYRSIWGYFQIIYFTLEMPFWWLTIFPTGLLP